MALDSGTRLGPYEILSPIGAGGMGEVYEAKDTRLDRTVAIKVLPERLAADPERRKRFELEARAVSSLNHPNVCTLYEFDTQDGVDFLVMEYIEGEALNDRLAKGPLPLDEALRYAIQILDGLDRAHREGVVHRDLKPGNIMLTKSGVKLLDFGLAKLAAPGPAQGAILSEHPTEQKPLTEAGVIVGTLQYMAPEQLEGREADARSDLFAFGAVVYEMVTGRHAFEGSSQASLIAAKLNAEPPPMTERKSGVPDKLDRIVMTCLAKDREDRWQTARDLKRELEWVTMRSADDAVVAARGHDRLQLVLLWIIAVAAVLAAWSVMRSSPPAPDAVRVLTLARAVPGAFAISPNGETIVYTSNEASIAQLFRRRMGELSAAAIAGSDGAMLPFFSPDGEWIAFGANGELTKVSLEGGLPVRLCPAQGLLGGHWGEGDLIVFGRRGSGLWRVSADGGEPDELTHLNDGEFGHAWPQILPDGETVLFTVLSNSGQTAHLATASLEGGEHRTLTHNGEIEGTYSRYVSTGHILFAQAPSSSIWAVPFDLGRLEVTGAPAPVREDVFAELDPTSGNLVVGDARYAVADDGTLVYELPPFRENAVVSVDDRGNATPLIESPAEYRAPRLSPDGTRVAVTARSVARSQIQIFDIERRTLDPLTVDGDNQWPVWSPDGVWVTFGSTRSGNDLDLYRKTASGAGEPELLLRRDAAQFPMSYAPTGELVYEEKTATSQDIWVLKPNGETEPIVATRALERSAMFSPSGRWIAYVSDVSGQDEVYVMSYPPDPTSRKRVSTAGGRVPFWSRDGRELFYRQGDVLMAASIREVEAGVGSKLELELGRARRIFAGYMSRTHIGDDSVTDDGTFLMIERREERDVSDLVVVLHWTDELERLIP